MSGSSSLRPAALRLLAVAALALGPGAIPVAQAADPLGADGDYVLTTTIETASAFPPMIVRDVEATPDGGLYAIDYYDDGTPGTTTVVRASVAGEVVASWSWDVWDSGSFITVYHADVDDEGNLAALMFGNFGVEGSDQRVAVFSPVGELLASVDLPSDQLLGTPLGMTTTGRTIHVVTAGNLGGDPSGPMTGLRVSSFSWDGTPVGHLDVPGQFMPIQYNTIVGNADGTITLGTVNLAFTTRSVSTYRQDGTLLRSWQVPADGFDLSGWMDVDDEGHVLLARASGPEQVQVFSPDGVPLAAITVNPDSDVAPDSGVSAGPDGRVFVGGSSFWTDGEQGIAVFDRLAAPRVTPVSWTATTCEPFTGQLTASAAPATVTFALTSGALPAGLELDQASGTVTGTPTAPGTFSAAVVGTNGVTPPPDAPEAGLVVTVGLRQFLATPVPVVTGTPVVGSTLTGAVPVWQPAADLTLQWTRDGLPIDGATAPTYTLAAADADRQIALVASGPTQCFTPTSVPSAAITVQAEPGPPAPTAPPTPTDEPTAGQPGVPVPSAPLSPSSAPSAAGSSPHGIASTGAGAVAPAVLAAVGALVAGLLLVHLVRRRVVRRP